MEQSCHSSVPSTATLNGGGTGSGSGSSSDGAADCGEATTVQNALRALNRSSHKISKASTRNPHQHHGPVGAGKLDSTGDGQEVLQPPPPQAIAQGTPPLHQPQPPVYNINKNDFRDVVQKLTGSPAHSNPPAKPAVAPVVGATGGAAAAASSRLQKNRPPPLSHLGPRLSPPLPQPELPTGCSAAAGPSGGEGAAVAVGNAYLRPWMVTPLSPLPPLPTVSAAAESPITAYMRSLRGGSSGGLLQLQGPVALSSPMGAPLFPLPSSPLAVGCQPSPQSAYQMTLPSSPRLPIPSPKWKDP